MAQEIVVVGWWHKWMRKAFELMVEGKKTIESFKSYLDRAMTRGDSSILEAWRIDRQIVMNRKCKRWKGHNQINFNNNKNKNNNKNNNNNNTNNNNILPTKPVSTQAVIKNRQYQDKQRRHQQHQQQRQQAQQQSNSDTKLKQYRQQWMNATKKEMNIQQFEQVFEQWSTWSHIEGAPSKPVNSVIEYVDICV